MKRFKDKSLADRLSDKAAAKKALLSKFQAQPGPDDPAVQARAAERKAIAEARAERQAAKAAAAEQAEQERLAREAALQEEKKRERDRRYAARKAAKK